MGCVKKIRFLISMMLVNYFVPVDEKTTYKKLESNMMSFSTASLALKFIIATNNSGFSYSM